MKGQAASNYKKRKIKKVESNLDLGTHNQAFKQLRQLNAGITTYLSVLTLNVNGRQTPSKGTLSLTGFKRKI
jgi:uncharacterized protein (DUF2225 family)